MTVNWGAMTVVRKKIIDLGYRPRKPFLGYHRRKQRWACIVAHRRAGKTVACVMDLIHRALKADPKTKPDARFAYIAPFYNQAKDAAWLYLKKYTAPIPGISVNESELRVDFAHNGARIRLYGADNYDRMRGGYFDGAILDEYADMHPAAWAEVIRPMLADRQGWATFIGTPKGRNDFFEVWERGRSDSNWYALMLRGSSSGLIAQSELDAMRAEMTPAQYAQEIECDFNAPVVGAYYGGLIADAEAEGRITHVPHTPELPVHTAWDLGIGDSTAIWMFQVAGSEVRFIDYVENHGQPLSWYVAQLASRPYQWGDDFMPHDAKVRELSSGRTRIETLAELGRKPRLVPQHKVEDGINAVRVSFPQFWIDEVRCRQGLEALRQYRSEFDEQKKVFSDRPLHDWTSHSADAFRYAAMAWREQIAPKPKPKQPPSGVEVIITPAGGVADNLLDLPPEQFIQTILRDRRKRTGRDHEL